MTIEPKIDYIMFGGVDTGGNPEYFIEDKISGYRLIEQGFTSREEARAYLDAHREEILRRGLPVLDASETELYIRLIKLAEHRLAEGKMNADGARELATKLAGIEERCPDEAFRQRLVLMLENLRAM